MARDPAMTGWANAPGHTQIYQDYGKIPVVGNKPVNLMVGRKTGRLSLADLQKAVYSSPAKAKAAAPVQSRIKQGGVWTENPAYKATGGTAGGTSGGATGGGTPIYAPGGGGTSYPSAVGPKIDYAKLDQLVKSGQVDQATAGLLMAQSYDDANRAAIGANEARYADITGGYQSRYGEGMGMVNQLGQSQRNEINRQFNALQGKQMTDLVGRGLSNSTVLTSAQQGIERERGRARTELEDQLLRTRLGQHNVTSGDTLGFMERRNDVQPDLGQMSALMMAMGQYGSGGGGGGGGYVAAAPQFLSPGAAGYSMPSVSWGGGASGFMPSYQSNSSYVPGYQGPTAAQLQAQKSAKVAAKYQSNKARSPGYGADVSPYMMNYASGLV